MNEIDASDLVSRTIFPAKGHTVSFEFLSNVAVQYLSLTVRPRQSYKVEWVPADGRCQYHALYVYIKILKLESRFIETPISSENLKYRLLKYNFSTFLFYSILIKYIVIYIKTRTLLSIQVPIKKLR